RPFDPPAFPPPATGERAFGLEPTLLEEPTDQQDHGHAASDLERGAVDDRQHQDSFIVRNTVVSASRVARTSVGSQSIEANTRPASFFIATRTPPSGSRPNVSSCA